MDLTSCKNLFLAKEIELMKREVDVLTIVQKLQQMDISVNFPPSPSKIPAKKRQLVKNSPFAIPDVLNTLPDMMSEDTCDTASAASQSVDGITKFLKMLKEPSFDEYEISETNRDRIKMWELGIDLKLPRRPKPKVHQSSSMTISKKIASYASPVFKDVANVNVTSESPDDTYYLKTPLEIQRNRLLVADISPGFDTPHLRLNLSRQQQQKSPRNTPVLGKLYSPKENFNAGCKNVLLQCTPVNRIEKQQQIPKEPELVSTVYNDIQQNLCKMEPPKSPQLTMHFKCKK